MKDIWPDFKSFTVTFKNQEDFDLISPIRESFDVIDISWSERIFNFDLEDERQRFINIITSLTYGIKEGNITLGD